MQKNTKHEIGDSWEQKWTEKHETFVIRVQFWTRKHDIPIRRQSEKTVKMHTQVTSSSENHVKMHTTKNPARVQIQAAVKAEGPQHKENPGPLPLPGKMH